MLRRLQITLVLVLSLALSARADEVVEARNAVVIAGHPLATKLGMAVLDSGGSAADALVTVSLALNVTEPSNSGIGGKFIMLYFDAKTKKVSCLAAMDASPLTLKREILAGKNPKELTRGYITSCTPGLLAALDEAHKKWGHQPWNQLVTPAADLAEKGFILSDRAAEMMGEFPMKIDPEAARIYAPGGKHPKEGDRMKYPDLAHSLRMIAEMGPKALYDGPLGKRLADGMKTNGGYISLEDLKKYKPRWIEPLAIDYKGQQIYSSPPPLSGGSTVLMTMACLGSDAWDMGSPRDAKYTDVICRVMQQVYPMTTALPGDSPTSLSKVREALREKTIKQLDVNAKNADPATVHPLPVGRGQRVEGNEVARADYAWNLDDGNEASTTHLIIVDREGNVACVTQSLGLHFGSAVVAPGTGFLLNGDLSNFSLSSTRSVNAYAPGKWPRSTMSPTIVVKDGKPVLAIGSPAGQRIPSVVLEVMIDVLDFHVPLAKAIEAPRFHLRKPTGSAEPANLLDLEEEMPTSMDEKLKNEGWTTTRHKRNEFYFGSVNAAYFAPDGTIVGVADQRRTADAGGN